MAEPSMPRHLAVKILSATFAVLIAPILSGVAIVYIQKKLDDPKPDPAPQPTAPAPVTAKAEVKADPKDAPKSSPVPPAVAVSTSPTPTAPAHPAVPKKKKAAGPVIRLFNGRDLTGFETYLSSPARAKAAHGSHGDPEKVFTVRAGQLHISGKVFGGLATVREYENYHLTVEYKWGEKRWPPREDAPRLSGIVLHASGPPGAVHGRSMAGIHCIISEYDTGSLALPDGMPKSISLCVESERLIFGKAERTMFVYKPGEPLTTVSSGIIHRLAHRPPALAKAAARKGERAVDNPIGEWNTLECHCAGGTITVTLNGTVVNVVSRASQTRGKLFFESQGAEIIFRTIDMRPVTAVPTAHP